MDCAILQRSLGLPLGPGRRPDAVWGVGSASETLVRKLQLEHSLQEPRVGMGTSTAINDLSWDCSGRFLASAGDDCALHVFEGATGRVLRSFDPVRAFAAQRAAQTRSAWHSCRTLPASCLEGIPRGRLQHHQQLGSLAAPNRRRCAAARGCGAPRGCAARHAGTRATSCARRPISLLPGPHVVHHGASVHAGLPRQHAAHGRRRQAGAPLARAARCAPAPRRSAACAPREVQLGEAAAGALQSGRENAASPAGSRTVAPARRSVETPGRPPPPPPPRCASSTWSAAR